MTKKKMPGHSVITQKQAKQITGGRTPNMLAEVERARKELRACLTIDDAKYFANKADALAAWANTYRDEGVKRDAAALKLEAFRRMGLLSEELRPNNPGKVYPNPKARADAHNERRRLAAKGELPSSRSAVERGARPGPQALLVEHGLSRERARTARRIAAIPQHSFDAAISRALPPSPSVLSRQHGSDAAWAPISKTFYSVVGAARKTLPRDAALAAPPSVRESVLFLMEWLDAFEQALPKAPK